MEKVYEAFGDNKEDLLDTINEYTAFDKSQIGDIGIKDLLMVTRVNTIPHDEEINAIWSLNGIEAAPNEENCILIFEPLTEQLFNHIKKVGANSTSFVSPIKLSGKAILLMPIKKYDELCQDEETQKTLDSMNVRLYEGKEELAVKMLMFDKGYIHLNVREKGYVADVKRHPDIVNFIKSFIDLGKMINNQIRAKNFTRPYVKEKKFVRSDKGKSIREQKENYRMITGLTGDVEGSIALDDEMKATTDIGKRRENQEDAVLLIRDEQNPDFKMMVVADGMGGLKSGEIASDVIVNRLKSWFENLSEKQKSCFDSTVESLKEDLIETIELDVQLAVESETWQQGGSTLVCAIIGKNDTLIANVGDSRAYIVQDGKLLQISREDTVAQMHLKKGVFPTKEASRFDQKSNILLQNIGMDRRMLVHPHSQVIKNSDYDLLMLFTDGVTDCLSDDDIVAVCKTSDKEELANKIVEKAIRHDSFVPEEYIEYTGLNAYIPGGKDNATAAVYTPKKYRKSRGEREK